MTDRKRSGAEWARSEISIYSETFLPSDFQWNPEVEWWTLHGGKMPATPTEGQLLTEIERLRSVIEGVSALHYEDDEWDGCKTCHGTSWMWPCPTAQALQ